MGFDRARVLKLDFWRPGVPPLLDLGLRSTEDLRVAEAYSPDFLRRAKLISDTGRPEKLLAGFYTVG